MGFKFRLRDERYVLSEAGSCVDAASADSEIRVCSKNISKFGAAKGFEPSTPTWQVVLASG